MKTVDEEIIISTLSEEELLKNPIPIGLDNDWIHKSRNFDQRVKAKGVYILHSSPTSRILYIGQTKGASMDFATRLYRHAKASASGNSKVYRALKKIVAETKSSILASLVPTEQIRSQFKGKPLRDGAKIDIYEQVLIHLLNPELNNRTK